MFVQVGDRQVEIDTSALREPIQRLVHGRHNDALHGELIEGIVEFVVATIVQSTAYLIKDLKEQIMSDLSNLTEVAGEIQDTLSAQGDSIAAVEALVTQLEQATVPPDVSPIVTQLRTALTELQGNNQALNSVIPAAPGGPTGPTGATGATGSTTDGGVTGASGDAGATGAEIV